MGKEECDVILKEPARVFVLTCLICVSVSLVFLFCSRQTQHKLYVRIASGGNDAFYSYIAKNYSVDYREEFSLLVSAILNDNFYQVNALVKEGVDVNAVELHSVTPLMFAAENADSSIVHLLLESGATVTNRDANGNNALNYAALGNPENIDLLVAAGVDANNANKDGFTPLLKAVKYHEKLKRNYVDVLTLLYLGANVLCTNKFGETPLSVALQSNDTNLIALLQVNWQGLNLTRQP